MAKVVVFATNFASRGICHRAVGKLLPARVRPDILETKLLSQPFFGCLPLGCLHLP